MDIFYTFSRLNEISSPFLEFAAALAAAVPAQQQAAVPGRVFAQLRVAAVAAPGGGGGELGSAATAPRPLVASSSPAAGA